MTNAVQPRPGVATTMAPTATPSPTAPLATAGPAPTSNTGQRAVGALVGMGMGASVGALMVRGRTLGSLSLPARTCIAAAAGVAAGIGGFVLGGLVGDRMARHPIGRAAGLKDVDVIVGHRSVKEPCDRREDGNTPAWKKECTHTRAVHGTRPIASTGDVYTTYQLGGDAPSASISDLASRFHGQELGPGPAAVVRVEGGYALRRLAMSGIDRLAQPWDKSDGKLDPFPADFRLTDPSIVGVVGLTGMLPSGGYRGAKGEPFFSQFATPNATDAETAELAKFT